jgi:catechol 1,2-dioxygenase
MTNGAPTLPIDATVTEAVGNVGEHSIDRAALVARIARDPTEDDVLGPYYRRGAPFRGKVSPPLSVGDVLQISGRVWAVSDRRPIGGALLDIWQANAQGHYDNETIHPGPYKMDENTWRSPHIHFVVRALGFKTLVTQLFFRGAEYLDSDPFVKRSLIIPLTTIDTPLGTYRTGRFDIVLGIDVDPAG